MHTPKQAVKQRITVQAVHTVLVSVQVLIMIAILYNMHGALNTARQQSLGSRRCLTWTCRGQASGAEQQQREERSRSAQEAANRAAAQSRQAAEEAGTKAAATAAKAQQDADQEIERMLQELKRNASRSSD